MKYANLQTFNILLPALEGVLDEKKLMEDRVNSAAAENNELTSNLLSCQTEIENLKHSSLERVSTVGSKLEETRLEVEALKAQVSELRTNLDFVTTQWDESSRDLTAAHAAQEILTEEKTILEAELVDINTIIGDLNEKIIDLKAEQNEEMRVKSEEVLSALQRVSVLSQALLWFCLIFKYSFSGKYVGSFVALDFLLKKYTFRFFLI